jgi:integrase
MSKGTITRRGKSSWQLKYDLPRAGGRRRFAYATVRGKRADAEAELRKRLSALDTGVHVDPTRMTLAAYLESWLRDVAPETVQAKALERYRGLVRNQIVPHLGSIAVQKLRPVEVKNWISALVASGLSVRSVRHAHGVLRTALAHAASVEIVARNVAKLVRAPRLEKKKPAILEAGQIAVALAKLEGLSIYPIAATALGTGARRGEIAGLTWADVDLDAATVTIARSIEQTAQGLRVKPPKTESGYRTITLPAFVVKALRQHRVATLELRLQLAAGPLPNDAPVFATLEGGWISPFSISDRWRNAVKNRGLPRVTLHSLRHSHASALIAADLDVVSISKRLGHASPALTLSVYSHLFRNKDQDAADAIDAAFSA